MEKLVIVAAVASLSLPLLAGIGWEKEPTSYREVPFGASESEAQSKIGAKSKEPFFCEDGYFKPEHRVCFSRTEMSGIDRATHARLRYFPVDEELIFTSGKLVAVVMSFDSGSYADMKSALVDMYGEPAKKESSTVTDTMGAMFQDEKVLWKGKRMILKVQRYSGGNLRTARAFLGTIAYYDEKVKRGLES